MAEPRASALLEIRDLNVFYGRSHALQGVNLRLEHGILSLVGRNGMGKTTLCKAIIGLIPAASGSIRFRNEELVGRSPADIARLGLGYVPQGRRLWPSLTVEEHLRLAGSDSGGQWTIPRIYETFPRLAERRTNRGNQLSGGEQQMLAISRALLLNPRLLVMDEPTEGLAPVIVEQVEEMLLRIGEEGEIGVFVVEQNIGVATAVAEKVAIMINGRVNRIMDAPRLAADRDLQQRLLGVGQHGAPEEPAEAAEEAPATDGRERPARPRGPVRVYLSNPTIPTRWSQPVPAAQIEASARTRTVAPEPATPLPASTVDLRPIHRGGAAPVIVAGTLDTKGDELRFIRDRIAAAGVRVVLVDLSTSGQPSPAEVPPHHVATYYRGGPNAVFTNERGAAIAAMAEAFAVWIRRQEPIGGLISAGGSGGSSLVAPAMRSLPIGVPKVLISTVASGNVAPYVGPADIMMLYSVTDVAGLNSISRQVLANGAAAMVGMVKARAEAERERAPTRRGAHAKPAIGLTMFGVTTPCVDAVVDALDDEFECLVFHATGVGGQSMEKLVEFRRARRRDRHHHHRGLRSPFRRPIAGDGGSLRRGDPHASPLYRFVRRARHGQFRPDGNRARALPRAHVAGAQSDRDADAHDAGGERATGALDRRTAQSHGRRGAVLPAGGRRLRARRARKSIFRSARRRGAVQRARADGATDRFAAPHPRAGEYQRSRLCGGSGRRIQPFIRVACVAPAGESMTAWLHARQKVQWALQELNGEEVTPASDVKRPPGG